MKLKLPSTTTPEAVAAIASLLGLKTPHGLNALLISLENVTLIDKKQQDYGPENISSFGAFGVLVRMNDKMSRLKNLFNKQGRRRRALNESIEDTYRDLANYAIISLLCDKHMWPLTSIPLTPELTNLTLRLYLNPIPPANQKSSSTEIAF